MPEPTVPLDFVCPRCGGAAREEHYGPCEPCRAELRADVRGEARAATSTDFEPKLHVTPNAVALKE